VSSHAVDIERAPVALSRPLSANNARPAIYWCTRCT
jgi:hypothetical protein